MKKILIALTIIISCLGISRVSAESVEFNYGYNYYHDVITNFSDLSFYLNKNDDKISHLYKILFDKYNYDYAKDYPFYILKISSSSSSLTLSLSALKSPVYLKTNGEPYGKTYYEDGTWEDDALDRHILLSSTYSFNSGTYSSITIQPTKMNSPGHYGLQAAAGSFNENFFLDSNFDIKIYTDMDNIIIHNYRDTNSDYIINSGDVYPTLYKNGISFINSYIEINLNNYAYVALALKDYSKYNFSTTIQVKGQYCPTPIYGMGLQSSEDIYGKKVGNVCTPYYDDFTPVVLNFPESLVKNFPVYYVKSYDTTKENIIKVYTSVFDITYISEEDKDNPYVLVQGNIYPTIPFDKLPSNTIQNTEIGYIPEDEKDFSFDDIFTAPLDFLLEIWGTITTFFSLITSFIALMPPELRGFLFASFTLGISLGLIKIIIG